MLAIVMMVVECQIALPNYFLLLVRGMLIETFPEIFIIKSLMEIQFQWDLEGLDRCPLALPDKGNSISQL